MNYYDKYQEKIARFNAREYIGYYPYQLIPITKIAKLKFAKQIKINQKDDNVSLLGRFLSLFEEDNIIKKYLTDHHLTKSNFSAKADMFYHENTESEKAFITQNIAIGISDRYQLIYETDFKIELGVFVYYPVIEKETLIDIPYLTRN